MSEQETKQNLTGTEPIKEQAEYTPSVQSDFLRETIKQKPVNKKKLFRRTIITVVMAVVFGLVACFTFLVLEPLISNKLYPEEETTEVQFPEETVSEEMKPEDMLVEVPDTEETTTAELENQQIEEILSQMEFSLDDYQSVYTELAKLAETTSRCVVTVTGVSSDVDWFNDIYESESSASGVIVANNGKSILILVSTSALKDADNIVVTFCNQAQVETELVQKDNTTGLAILSVELLSIDEDTMDVISIAKLGSSNSDKLLGMPIIALGSPAGLNNSVCYGIVTSLGTIIDQPDSAYKMITTDIYTSSNATGILINLRGMVVGIIDNINTGTDMQNRLTAYGITELKKTIEKMSNNQELTYLGIHGADIPENMAETLGTQEGVYIKEIEIDSPAMTAGIQSGDVLIRVGNIPVANYNDLLNILYSAQPEDTIKITVLRQEKEMNVDVTLGRR